MEDKVVKIDIRKAISGKLAKASRWIPGFVYRWLARLIRQDELNRVLCENRGKTGSAFAEGALQTLGVSVSVIGEENIPPPAGLYLCPTILSADLTASV